MERGTPLNRTPEPCNTYAVRRPSRPYSQIRSPLGKRELALMLGNPHLQQILVQHQLSHQVLGSSELLLQRIYFRDIRTSLQSRHIAFRNSSCHRENTMPAALSRGSAHPDLHLAGALNHLLLSFADQHSPTSHSWIPPVTLSATKCVSNLFEV